MVMEWPGFFPIPVTVEAALDGWRQRIAHIEEEETRHFAGLPYIEGVAVIGSIGRRTPWPCSDVDLLVVVDLPRGRDAEDLVLQEEQKRNARLYRLGIVNSVEAYHWVFSQEDIVRDVGADEDAFIRTLEHQHWLGTVLKAHGGRAVYDPSGLLGQFLDRCNRVFETDRFGRLWLKKMIAYGEESLRSAGTHASAGNWASASLEILRVAYQRLPCGAYAMWRRLPESSGRAVSRFLRAAEEEHNPEVADLYLKTSRLEENVMFERFASLPPEAKKERDLALEIRQGSGETTDELSVTRDLLNASLWEAVVRDGSDGPRPVWTGVTGDRDQVGRQLEAAHALVACLSGKRTGKPLSPADADKPRG